MALAGRCALFMPCARAQVRGLPTFGRAHGEPWKGGREGSGGMRDRVHLHGHRSIGTPFRDGHRVTAGSLPRDRFAESIRAAFEPLIYPLRTQSNNLAATDARVTESASPNLAAQCRR